MTETRIDAFVKVAELQLNAASDLVSATNRIIEGARMALTMAATRADVHAEALAALEAVQLLHSASIEGLRKTQEHILENLRDRSTP